MRGQKIRILDEAGKCVLEKAAAPVGVDRASGDFIWRADFSELETEGNYCIQVCPDGDEKGDADEKGAAAKYAAGCILRQPLHISRNLYRELVPVLCRTFYYQRCGMELEETYAGVFHRKSCHEEKAWRLEDYRVLKKGVEAAKTLPRFDVSGGWHDAGDYGRYTTAAATAAAHLLYAWEWFPESFQDSCRIPESGGTMADILSECRYELEWLLKMQREDGGVNHKVTSMRHACFVMPDQDHRPLILFPVSSAATAAFAAVMALASRVYETGDPDFARKALAAARRGWDWLERHPLPVEFHNPEGCNTGEYGDPDDRDERLWAAAELYAATKDQSFLEQAYQLQGGENSESGFGLGWRNVEGFAAFSFLREEIKRGLGQGRERGAGVETGEASDAADDTKAGNERTERTDHWDASQEEMLGVLKRKYHQWILEEARAACRFSRASGYMAVMEPGDFGWGSNMVPAVRGMILAAAYGLAGENEFRDTAGMQMDYLLGVNALGYSYITGVGQNAVRRPHNRVLEADGIEEPIPGYVSGGPNPDAQDEKAEWLLDPGTPPMKCFLDLWECYSLNETAIYWNSPVVFLAAFLAAESGTL